jgi:hypothetical protein
MRGAWVGVGWVGPCRLVKVVYERSCDPVGVNLVAKASPLNCGPAKAG